MRRRGGSRGCSSGLNIQLYAVLGKETYVSAPCGLEVSHASNRVDSLLNPPVLSGMGQWIVKLHGCRFF